MRNILVLAITCFFLTHAANAQSVGDLQIRAKSLGLKDITISYDRFKDKTTITTKPHNLIGSTEGAMANVAHGMLGPGAGAGQMILMMTVGYQFAGASLDATGDRFAIVFRSDSHNWVYAKGDQNLYILYDNKRLELHPLSGDSDIVAGLFYDVTVTETLGFKISREKLAEIAAATKVEMKLGDSKPRTWKPDLSKRVNQILAITAAK